MPEHHEHDHDHEHEHEHGELLTLADRHAHEAQTYDRMARDILATWSGDDYRVDPERIPFANREHVEFLSDAVRRLGPLAGRRVLEVGAGGGSLAVWLALQGAEVVGIDVSPGILEVARRRAEVNGVADRVTFVNVPIEYFDPRAAGLPHDDYDAIIGNNVVHHFDRDLAMRRIGALMAPGAVAVFCEPVLFLPEWTPRVRNPRRGTRRFPMHTHTPDERAPGGADFAVLRRWFRTVRWTPYQVLCRLQNFVELSDPAWRRLERTDRFLLRRIPGTRWICRMAVISLTDPVPADRRTTDPGHTEPNHTEPNHAEPSHTNPTEGHRP